MTPLLIHNMAIPLADRFITPDLEQTLNYYPFYQKSCGKPLSFQAYLLRVCKHLDQHRDETDEPLITDWLRRYLDHFGLADFASRAGADADLCCFAQRIDIANLISRP